ncbi:MAG: TIR domain-containing protein [Lachnospiraceae bacterium]|nr:TIR domain-containing protein [Lachnospiraceae bacterium]
MAIEHYDAFISYRHNPRDSAVASAIQKGLEHFRIPLAVRKTAGVKRIERIFRDKEELPITSDLGEDIDRALLQSDFLIVICSPELQQSRWCLRELEMFLSTHDREHVLTVMTEGEPGDVIPPVLLKEEKLVTDEDGNETLVVSDVEPLACDYREAALLRTKKAFRKAGREELPRLAAAMLGCSYDELIRRRQQYRMRVAFGAAAAVTVTASAAIAYLLWSRAEIRSNYNQALVNESLELSLKSAKSLENEDRMTAIAQALEALPSGEMDRPLTAEAQYALSEAVMIYHSSPELTETRIFSGRDKIADYAFDADGKYIVAMDESGALSVFDADSRVRSVVWEISVGEDIPAMKLLADRTAAVAAGNCIFAMDYVAGDQLWITEFAHSGIQMDILSDPERDPGWLLAENSDNLAKIDPESGDIILRTEIGALRDLPESAYFFGVTPNPWGETAAVPVRLGGGGTNSLVAVWNTGTGAITLPSQPSSGFNTVKATAFTGGDRLAVVYMDEEDAPEYGRSTVVIRDNPVRVVMLDAAAGKSGGKKSQQASGPLWTASFDHAQPVGQVKAVAVPYTGRKGEVKQGLLVAFGGTVVTLDAETGETVVRRDLGSPVRKLINADALGYIAVLESGQTVQVTYSPSSTTYVRQFTDGLSDVAFSPRDSLEEQQAAVLRDGKLLLYENEDNPVYEGSSGDSSASPVRKSVIPEGSGALFSLTEEPSVLVTGLEDNLARRAELTGETYDWWLAGSFGGSAVLLKNTDRLEIFTMGREDDAPVLLETAEELPPVPADPGAFLIPYGHLAELRDGRLWYCPEDRRMLSVDLASGETAEILLPDKEETAGFTFGCRQDLIHYGTLFLPSPVFVSPGAERVLCYVWDEEAGENRAVILRTGDGEMLDLGETPYSGIPAAAWSADGKRAAYAANYKIAAAGEEGILFTIPCGERTVRSMTYLGGELAVLYSDHTLSRYGEDGALLSELELDLEDSLMGFYEEILWDRPEYGLIVSADHQAFLVDADSWPGVPAARIENYLGCSGEFFWNFTPGAESGRVVYRTGRFRKQSIEELIGLGQKLIDNP